MDITSAIQQKFAIGIHSSYRSVFGTPEGRRVLAHLCKKAFVFDSTYSKDPIEMSFREGQRAFALAIVRYVDKNTEKLLADMKEYNNKYENPI